MVYEVDPFMRGGTPSFLFSPLALSGTLSEVRRRDPKSGHDFIAGTLLGELLRSRRQDDPPRVVLIASEMEIEVGQGVETRFAARAKPEPAVCATLASGPVGVKDER